MNIVVVELHRVNRSGRPLDCSLRDVVNQMRQNGTTVFALDHREVVMSSSVQQSKSTCSTTEGDSHAVEDSCQSSPITVCIYRIWTEFADSIRTFSSFLRLNIA